MLPNFDVVIQTNGDSKLIGLEKSEHCHNLNTLAEAAGKVTSQIDKDHPPVTTDIHVQH